MKINTLDGIFYKNFDETATYSLEMLSKFIDVDEMVIIAINDEKVKVIKTHTNNRLLLPEGTFLHHSQGFADLLRKNKYKPIVTMDVSKDETMSKMDIHTIYAIQALICVPIIERKGDIIGFLLAANTQPFEFKEEHTSLMNLVVTNLSYVLDLEEKVIKDSLTGAYSRNYLESYFPEWAEKFEANPTQKGIGMYFIDFDGFKAVNDTYGHEAGDFLLIDKVGKMNGVLPDERDFVTRLGGDEFMVLVHYTNKDDLIIVGKKLLESISSPCLYGDIILGVSASMGIAIYPEDGSTIQELVKVADQKMYQIKATGKNNFMM